MIIYHLTWPHYWLTVAIVLLIYYVLLLLTGFRREIGDYLNGKHRRQSRPDAENNFEEDEELMGQAAEEYGVGTVDSEEIRFAPTKVAADESYPFPDDGALNGLIPDVLEEVKTIIHTIATEQGTKEDFISLFKLVSAKYPKIQQSRHLEAINEWIKDNVPFDLNEDELTQLWE